MRVKGRVRPVSSSCAKCGPRALIRPAFTTVLLTEASSASTGTRRTAPMRGPSRTAMQRRATPAPPPGCRLAVRGPALGVDRYHPDPLGRPNLPEHPRAHQRLHDARGGLGSHPQLPGDALRPDQGVGWCTTCVRTLRTNSARRVGLRRSGCIDSRCSKPCTSRSAKTSGSSRGGPWERVGRSRRAS